MNEKIAVKLLIFIGLCNFKFVNEIFKLMWNQGCRGDWILIPIPIPMGIPIPTAALCETVSAIAAVGPMCSEFVNPFASTCFISRQFYTDWRRFEFPLVSYSATAEFLVTSFYSRSQTHAGSLDLSTDSNTAYECVHIWQMTNYKASAKCM